MLTAFRLFYAMRRFELRLLIVAAAATVVATLWVAYQMSAARSAELTCIREANALATQVADARCREFQPMLDGLMTVGGLLGLAAGAAPFLLGLVLGVPLVAAEVERGTASTAWTLSASRLHWLMRRLVPMIVVVGVVTLIIGLTGDALARAYPAFDGADPGFGSYGMRGPLLVARGVAVLMIGSAIGALMGRTLPAIVASAAICLAIFIGLFMFTDQLMRAEAIPLSLGAAQSGASQAYDMGYRDDVSGEITTFENYYQTNGGGSMEGGEIPGMTMVAYAVPGSRYGEFVWREVGLLGGISLASLVLLLVVVQRRRPY